MRLRSIAAAGAYAFVCLVASSLSLQARADTFTVSIVQSGNDVVATGSGALGVSGTRDDGSGFSVLSANPAFLSVGSGEATVYAGVSGPAYGSGGPGVIADSSTGDLVGFHD